MQADYENPAFEKSPSTSQTSLADAIKGEEIVEIETIQNHSHVGNGTESMSLSSPELAVSVRNANKSYKKGTPVLNKFNMTVPAGTIYSLLGSSGCGKTTLLSCCVDLMKLDEGEILLFGHKPGTIGSGVPGKRVGYMPQELSLNGELTIYESLQFYSRIYGLTEEDIVESTQFLIEFLDLPAATRQISSLSGGQKRRVSVALALIHDPELLILDEPTVGVDPLLRESIWNYLVGLVSSGRTTVIITTHYVDEARQSNVIGIMRHGRLLAEKSPQALLKEFCAPDLDKIVLSLCRKDRDERKALQGKDRKKSTPNRISPFWMKHKPTPETSTIVENRNDCKTENTQIKTQEETDGFMFDTTKTLTSVDRTATLNVDTTITLNGERVVEREQRPVDVENHTLPRERTVDLRDRIRSRVPTTSNRLWALLVKNYIMLVRNVGFLVFVFIVPAVQVILICLTIGADPRDLRVGVVNSEDCGFEKDKWRNITSTCPIDGETGEAKSMSCFYLANLPEENFIFEQSATEKTAMEQIQWGRYYGYIMFPMNYTANLICRYVAHLDCPPPDVVQKQSNIIFQLDMSNKQIGQTMKRIFIETYGETMNKIRKLCESTIDPTLLMAASDTPYMFEKPIYGFDDTSFRAFLAPSILLGLLFFFPLCSSGVTYITEKKNGTLDRAVVAGVNTAELMTGFLISQLGILIGQAGFAFLILTQGFGVSITGSFTLAMFLSMLVGISGMSAGFLISTFCEEEVHAVLLAIGMFFPNILLAGMVWPLEGMDPRLLYISYLLPCTLACESMRSIVNRGWGLTHPHVWPGFASTIGWIVIYWTATILVRKYKNRT